MGLLDYADEYGKRFLGLLGNSPLVQLLRAGQGEAPPPDVSVNGLKNALLNTPVFDNSQDSNQNALNQALNWITPMGMVGKIVYHGSPHKFDKFDASKIGTGEGAQAYGHGLYLADSPQVARSYRESLSDPEVLMGGRPLPASDPMVRVALQKYEGVDPVAFWSDRVNESLVATKSKNPDFRQKMSAEMLGARQELLAAAKKYDPKEVAVSDGGALYKADLPDEWIPKMLDWDKPLSQQPEVLKALESHQTMGKDSIGWRGAPTGQWERAMNTPSRTGEWLYREIANNAPIETAAALQQAGIPGIKYLDGGSRGKGQGSYNYVVFPGLEDKVKILERNGVPLNGLLGP